MKTQQSAVKWAFQQELATPGPVWARISKNPHPEETLFHSHRILSAELLQLNPPFRAENEQSPDLCKSSYFWLRRKQPSQNIFKMHLPGSSLTCFQELWGNAKTFPDQPNSNFGVTIQCCWDFTVTYTCAGIQGFTWSVFIAPTETQYRIFNLIIKSTISILISLASLLARDLTLPESF